MMLELGSSACSGEALIALPGVERGCLQQGASARFRVLLLCAVLLYSVR